MASTGINLFLDKPRTLLPFAGTTAVREVYFSGFKKNATGTAFSYYLADKAPLYYRQLEHVVDSLTDGNFISAVADTLRKIPQAQSFQESHACEIIAALFAQEHRNLVLIYNKLQMLTAQNANAYKMDLVLCDPSQDPVTFLLGEVKSSVKTHSAGTLSGHDKSCYSDIFRSLNHYSDDDADFDLTAARDALKLLDGDQAEKIRKALLPYRSRDVRYAAFAVIDAATFTEAEAALLATQRNAKTFNVDIIGVEELQTMAGSAFARLNAILAACAKKCSP